MGNNALLYGQGPKPPAARPFMSYTSHNGLSHSERNGDEPLFISDIPRFLRFKGEISRTYFIRVIGTPRG